MKRLGAFMLAGFAAPALAQTLVPAPGGDWNANKPVLENLNPQGDWRNPANVQRLQPDKDWRDLPQLAPAAPFEVPHTTLTDARPGDWRYRPTPPPPVLLQPPGRDDIPQKLAERAPGSRQPENLRVTR